MSSVLTNLSMVLGRLFIVTIFLLSAVGNKIPNFSSVAQYMDSHGVPFPSIALAAAIAFLVVGSVSVLVGYQTRWGAALLLIFLGLATFFFHNFWSLEESARQAEMIQFMKNLSMAGTMLFLIGNGPGAWSVDALISRRRQALAADR